MKQKELVPKRRFEGFTGEWNINRLRDLASFSKGRGYSKKDLSSYGNPIILYGHLYTDYKSDIQKVESYAIKKENSVISQGNEVIVPSSGESAKDIARASTVRKSGIILGGDLNIIKPNQMVDSMFLGLSITNSSVQKELIKRVQGSSVVHLYNSDIEEVNLIYPSTNEQQKIGEFFRLLDEMIALEQRKINKTKALKNAYLAEMFPAEGERVPKRRFAGYTGEWRRLQLGNFGSVAMNKRIFKSETSKIGEVPFYKIGTFGKEPDAFISRELFEEYKSKYEFPEKGDILISASGSIGRTVEYTGKDEYFQDSNIVWLKHQGRLNNLFLKQFYKIIRWEGLEGSTIKRLYNQNILKTKIDVPSLEEQQKIGQFFKSLDDKITTQERKLEKLKAIKQAYLHEMFV